MGTLTITYYKDKDLYDMYVKRKEKELINKGMERIEAINVAKQAIDRVACTQSLQVNTSKIGSVRDLVAHITATKHMQYTFEVKE